MNIAVRGAKELFALSFKASPARAIFALITFYIDPLVTAILPLFVKFFTDNAIGGHVRGVLEVGAMLAAIEVASTLGRTAMTLNLRRLEEVTAHALDQRMMGLVSRIPGVEHHERPDFLKELDLLRSRRGELTQFLVNWFSMLSYPIMMTVTMVLLARLHPLIWLLPLFTGPSILLTKKSNEWIQQSYEETAEPQRLIAHLFQVASAPAAGKELRIFGLQGEIKERHHRLWSRVNKILYRAEAKSTASGLIGYTISAVGYTGAVALVVLKAVSGGLTIGDVLMALMLARRAHGHVTTLAQYWAFYLDLYRLGGRFGWLLEYAETADCPVDQPATLPSRLSAGIDLVDVSFRYPGTEAEVLSHVNLHLPAGSTVALVGENGAGKTTLVKLLCRLYEPSSGDIKVDGVSLKRFEINDWRRALSASFQDFVNYELLAREAVGVGDLPKIDDHEAIQSALERANASEVVDQLPEGLETQLGKSFERGEQLSTGQWQKLALGRSMMRMVPLLLVMDEPTASLDAEAEARLFDHFTGAAERVAKTNGGITLFVSHRFSTVRMADLIVVVDGGRIIEVGSHSELVVKGGLYAEIFELQARSYR